MNKLAAWINGYDYKDIKNHTPDSKRKVRGFAIVIWLPTLLWLLTGYFTAYGIYNLGIGSSIFIALVSGGLVFLVERSIIISQGTWLLVVLRIVLGITVAYLGSQFIDVLIFREDMSNLREEYHIQEKAKLVDLETARLNSSIQDQEELVSLLYKDFKHQEQEYIYETDGRGGSGQRGFGAIAKAKKESLEAAEVKFAKAESELQSLKNRRNQLVERVDSEYAATTGVLVEYQLLYKLIDQNEQARYIYWAFTVFLVVIEFLVIIIKLTSKKTAIEREEEYMRDTHIRDLDYREREHVKLLAHQGQNSVPAQRALQFIKEQANSTRLL